MNIPTAILIILIKTKIVNNKNKKSEKKVSNDTTPSETGQNAKKRVKNQKKKMSRKAEKGEKRGESEKRGKEKEKRGEFPPQKMRTYTEKQAFERHKCPKKGKKGANTEGKMTKFYEV